MRASQPVAVPNLQNLEVLFTLVILRNSLCVKKQPPSKWKTAVSNSIMLFQTGNRMRASQSAQTASEHRHNGQTNIPDGIEPRRCDRLPARQPGT